MAEESPPLSDATRDPLIDLEPAAVAAIRQSFLAEVPDHLVRQLVGPARVREIPAGSVFITPEHCRCGVLVAGLARVYCIRHNGAEVTIQRVGPGAVLGIGAISGRAGDNCVVAVCDCLFLSFDASQLVNIGRQHVSVAWAIAKELAQRLDDAERRCKGAIPGTVVQRSAAALLDLCVDVEPIEVRLTQERMAEAIGASREAVGRAFRWLATAGLVDIGRGKVMIQDPLGLQSIARDTFEQREAPPTGLNTPREVRRSSHSVPTRS